MRELPGYRAELELLNTAFPDKNHLSIRDVASYLGCSVNTAKSRYPIISKKKGRAGVTKTALARVIANEV